MYGSRSGDEVRLLEIPAEDIGVGPLFGPLVREIDEPGRDADEGGRESDATGTETGLINLFAALGRAGATSKSVRDVDGPARGCLCSGLKRVATPSRADGDCVFVAVVFRDLAEIVLVTVVVGRVLARRGFSTSVFLAERARPVLIVGAAFRGEGDGRVRRSSVGVCLTGVISAFSGRRLARSSSCTKLNY